MDFWEIFTLVTGVIYLLLEVRQSNWMWVLGVLTGAAAVVVFFKGRLYANMALNIYYVGMSFWGLYAWARDSRKLAASDSEIRDDVIHLNRLSCKVVIYSALLFLLGTAALIFLLKRLNDPMSAMDAAVTVLSAICTWWLSRSYIQQWNVWFVADGMLTVLCAIQGMWWMAALYLFYTVMAIYGYRNWKAKGVYLK